MRPFRLRPNPLLLVAGALLLIGAGIGLEQALQARKTALAQARGAYLEALTATRTQLAGLVRKAAADRALAQSLQWKLDHSVRSALQGKLQKGGLDQLALADAGCKELASAALGRRIGAAPARCEPGFFWTATDGRPALGLVARLGEPAAKGDLVAIAYVRLDDDWLTLQPELKRRMAALGLVLGPESQHAAVVAREGMGEGGEALAALGTGRVLDAFLTRRSLASRGPDASWLWTALGFALICTAYAWIRERRAAAAAEARLRELAGWCAALSDADPPPADQEPVQAAKGLVTRALDAKADTLRALGAQKTTLEGTVRAQSEQLGRAKRRLAELAELDSLAIQLARTSPTFLDRVAGLHDRAEDLSDTLGGPVAERARHLFEMLMTWQEGVAERGARKFLRSLSETPGNAPDQTALDEQLVAMAVLAGEVCDMSVNASLEAHRLVEGAGFATQIAAYWRGLAGRSGDERPCASVLDALEEAQSLLKLDPPRAHVRFANRVDAADAARIPRLPQTIWTTALYHLLLAVTDGVPPPSSTPAGEAPSVAVRLRRDKGKALLVAQLAGDPAPATAAGSRQAYHLEIARAVLAPFDVGLAALPTLKGRFPLALTWSDEALPPAPRRELPEAPAPA